MITKEHNGDVYTFDAEQHIHALNGIPLHGVTTILGVLPKPWLVPWAAKVVANEFQERLGEYKKLKTKKDKDAFISDVKKAPTKTRDKAGDYGTIVHDFLERLIKCEKLTDAETDQIMHDPGMAEAISFSQDYLEPFNIIRSEANVWSKTYWYGGILDLLIRDKDGNIWIGDFKTSASFSKSWFAQMAAYHMAIQELGFNEPVHGYLAVHIPQKGKHKVITNEDVGLSTAECQEMFMLALQMHKKLKGAWK